MRSSIDLKKIIKTFRYKSEALVLYARKLTVFLHSSAKYYVFSSLMRRILFLNLTALVVLVLGVLYLNQFRDGLVGERIKSLMTQGEIISGAIAASVQMQTGAVIINPEKLLELQAGESLGPESDRLDNLEFPINPERIAPVLRRLISPMQIRARIYDRDGNILLDSRHLYSHGQVLHYSLPDQEHKSSGWFQKIKNTLFAPFTGKRSVLESESLEINKTVFEEALRALKGIPSTSVKKTEQGEQVISVALPIQRFHAVLGALVLSTEGGDIDKIIHNERKGILRVFGVAALTNAILSGLLASTIANPLRRLSDAAVRIQSGIKKREEIPNFKGRQDEIGNLAVAVRDMTNALYARIDAIERFAADVSHELKNPLTSLRSAVETLPMAKTEFTRLQLMDIIQHDVRRLNRLITDISDASRLDAELVREDCQRINLKDFLENIIFNFKEVSQKNNKIIEIKFNAEKLRQGVSGYYVMGHDLRLSQVMTNLIENARSFIPKENGCICIKLSRCGKYNLIQVEDNGPGIRAEHIDRIFERFYTDRSDCHEFGQNSGLGLSISRQIVEAHGGKLYAENIYDKQSAHVLGARFTASFPAIS